MSLIQSSSKKITFLQILSFFKNSPWNLKFLYIFRLSPLCMNEESWKKAQEIKFYIDSFTKSVNYLYMYCIGIWLEKNKLNLKFIHYTVQECRGIKREVSTLCAYGKTCFLAQHSTLWCTQTRKGHLDYYRVLNPFFLTWQKLICYFFH